MDKTPDELKKEKAHITEILSNLETSYRNAKVSEKNYNEVKESSQKRISEIDAALSSQPAAAEENLAGDFTSETAASMTEEVEVSASEKPKQDADVEMEKLKVLVETTRDEMKALQETVQGISESIGEVRSMAFQSEGLAKELEVKIEKSQDDINEIKPSEISKKIRKIDESLERIDIYDEKSETKFSDLSKKINLVYEMMKSAGGIENLSNLNREISKKTEEIKEAMHYIERLAAKTEKAFIEINKNLEDFHLYKSRQDNLEDAMKEMIKSLDESNLRIDNSSTKKELSSISSEMLLLKKQMDEINRVIPLIKIKLPEQIQNLTKEKDEVSAMLDLLDGQVKTGAISSGEFEKLKKANEAKMKKIEEQLEEEWKRFERLAESGELEYPESPIQLPPQSSEQVTTPAEIKPSEIQTSSEANSPSPIKPIENSQALPSQPNQTSGSNSEIEFHEPEKRKRGRPRKHTEEQPVLNDNAEKKPSGEAGDVIPENLKKMIEEAFEGKEKGNEIKETFENPETAKLYEQPYAKAEPKKEPISSKSIVVEGKNPDDIDDFVKEVADKYIGDAKTKEEFMKSVGESESHTNTPDSDTKKKKEEKKGKTFEIAKNIKEMM